MAKRTLGLAAAGGRPEDENSFKKWSTNAVGADNTKQWKTGKELLQHLEDACRGADDCIEVLYIFSHAWGYRPAGNRGGVSAGGPDNSGFYLKKKASDHADARDLDDLKAAIQAGKIRFCEPCKIVFTGCRVAASDFPKKLSELTHCTVVAAKGSSFPKPGEPGSGVLPGDETGEWASGAGDTDEATNGGYLGWLEFVFERGEVKVKEVGINVRGICIHPVWPKRERGRRQRQRTVREERLMRKRRSGRNR